MSLDVVLIRTRNLQAESMTFFWTI